MENEVVDSKRVSLIVPVEVHQILCQMANEADRSLNNYINLLFKDVVNDYLENLDRKN